jgi:hypothetical protein
VFLFSDIAMRKNLTEIIDIFQHIAVQPKNTIVENHRQNAAAETTKRVTGSNDFIAGNNSNAAKTVPVTPTAEKGHLRETWDEIKKLSEVRSSSKDKLVYGGNGVEGRRSKRSSDKSKDKKSGGSKKQSHADGCKTNFPHLGKLRGSGSNGSDSKTSSGAAAPCDCLPVIEMLGRRMEADRAEILTNLVERTKFMDSRLNQLETKTKKQIATFNQTMKVSLKMFCLFFRVWPFRVFTFF